MSKGDVEIEMNFKVGNAAAANNIMREVYRNQQAGLKQAAKQADITGARFSLMGKAFLGTSSLASILGAAASLKTAASDLKRAHKDMEEALTPLTSLGDNAKNLPAARVEVGRMAAETGRPVSEVSRATFDLQSSTGNFTVDERSKLQRDVIDMAMATGGDLSTAVNLLVKSKQIYGDSSGDTQTLSNKLLYTQDQAALSFEDLATRLPELAGSAKVVGVSFEELLGTMVAVSKKSGDIPGMFTSTRNILLLMEEAEEKGMHLSGNYLDKVKQLNSEMERDPKGFTKLFGKENVGTATLMAESANDILKEVGTINQIDGSNSRARDILGQRLQDPTHQAYVIDRSIDSLRENAPSLAGEKSVASWFTEIGRNMDLGALAEQFATGEARDSWSSTWGAFKGLLGHAPTIQRGREILLENTPEGPARDSFLMQNWEARNAEEVEKIMSRDLFSQTGLYFSKSDRARLDELKNVPFDLGREQARYPYKGPGGDSKALEENTAAVKQLSRDLQSIGSGGPGRKPGGARTNYEETL